MGRRLEKGFLRLNFQPFRDIVLPRPSECSVPGRRCPVPRSYASRTSQKHRRLKMLSAICTITLAFSPTAPLQPRAAATHMTRAATSEVAMLNLFGNTGAYACHRPIAQGKYMGLWQGEHV